jgi:hypothetical protein
LPRRCGEHYSAMAKKSAKKRSLNVDPKQLKPNPSHAEGDQAARAKSTGHGKKTADKWNQ